MQRFVEGADVQAERSSPVYVGQSLSDQIKAIEGAGSVASVGILDTNGNLQNVGGSEGDSFQAVSHARWRNNSETWPTSFPPRHGFVVPYRQPTNGNIGEINARALPGNRPFDVFVPEGAAEILQSVDHPAILRVILDVQYGSSAAIDCRRGNFRKAVQGANHLGPGANHALLSDNFRDAITNSKEQIWREVLDAAIPPLTLQGCALNLNGYMLDASWNFQMEESAGLELPDLGNKLTKGEGQGFRNGMIISLGKEIFKRKIGYENNLNFIHQIMMGAVSNRVIGRCRYRNDHTLYFRHLGENQWQVYLQMTLINHDGPDGGPRDQEPLSRAA